jgi:hypothetical protein
MDVKGGALRDWNEELQMPLYLLRSPLTHSTHYNGLQIERQGMK